jgi:hypothetical protein
MIKRYIVTFDLTSDDNSLYASVEDYLRKYSLFAKPTKNVYLVGGDNIDSESIKNDLKTILKNETVIFVALLGKSYSSFNYVNINNDLKKYFSKK